MDDQKIENLLNLALDATATEREKSSVLNVGYDPFEEKWDLIVKYSGSLEVLDAMEDVDVVELANEYAIVTIPEIYVNSLADIPQIEYVEKPKRLFFAVNQGVEASCIMPLQTAQYNLYGEGVLVAVIDSGVDYTHPDFRNEDGTTRIKNLWDQSLIGTPPAGYKIGAEYTSEQINEALQQPTKAEQWAVVPSRDLSGHGTGVLGIAAGNGRASNGQYQGVAARSDIIVVKLGVPREGSFPRTTELMQALDYVIKKSLEYQQPIAINLSFGNTYGSHDGTSLLETFIDDMSNIWKSAICVGTGNEGNSAGHTSGILNMNTEYEDIELAISSNEFTINVQIWKSYVDEFDISIVHPSGRIFGPFQEALETQRFFVDNTELLVYYGTPSPYSPAQEIFVDFIPRNMFIDSGIWKIRLIPKRIVLGNYNMWLPSSSVLNPGTRFYRPNPNTTLTIPSTARKVISVGAYDSYYRSYASFSGRGFTRLYEQVKPDVVAPGVNTMTTNTDGGYSPMTGTSFATPFVTGSAALLMQYGIIENNDAFLYGEKLKATLQRGAASLPGETNYPNPTLGYGTLCVRNSIQ